jgi:siroheme synthase (precorrin-2 oxidase/ferrochelatase)
VSTLPRAMPTVCLVVHRGTGLIVAVVSNTKSIAVARAQAADLRDRLNQTIGAELTSVGDGGYEVSEPALEVGRYLRSRMTEALDTCSGRIVTKPPLTPTSPGPFQAVTQNLESLAESVEPRPGRSAGTSWSDSADPLRVELDRALTKNWELVRQASRENLTIRLEFADNGVFVHPGTR